MAHDRIRRNLTTGEIAEMCGVNFRTVIRWIQRGHLRAFQLPGRGDNRIPIEDFTAFLRDNRMPIPPDLRSEVRSVLVVGFMEHELDAARSVFEADAVEVIDAPSEFHAGLEAGRGVPTAAVISAHAFDLEGLDRVVSGLGRLGAGVMVCGEHGGHLPEWVVGLDEPIDWTIVAAVVDDIATASD